MGSRDKEPKKRHSRRLPVEADLRIDDTLPENSEHPLARTPPEQRAISRLRLIASVLARLARRSAGQE